MQVGLGFHLFSSPCRFLVYITDVSKKKNRAGGFANLQLHHRLFGVQTAKQNVALFPFSPFENLGKSVNGNFLQATVKVRQKNVLVSVQQHLKTY